MTGEMLECLIEEGNNDRTGPLYRRFFQCRLHTSWTVFSQCLTQALENHARLRLWKQFFVSDRPKLPVR